MAQFDLSLFNQFLSEALEEPRETLNQQLQAQNKHYQLSVADFTEIAEERNQLFQDHHLLDFRWDNTLTLARFLATEPILYKSDYLEHLAACQAIFYYLRAYHPGQVADQAILEDIEERYRKYQGDLELLQGSFEDFPEGEDDE